MDDSGAKTTTTVVWQSSNTYKIESERTDTEERKLARSYLADGGGRNLVIVSNIPYEKCNLYVLLTPASSAFYRHTDVTARGTLYLGAGWFRITESRISYTPWTECDGRFTGNYIKVSGLKDSKLVFGSEFLRQADETESRGGIAGFVIKEADTDREDPAAGMAEKKQTAQENWTTSYHR